MGSNPAVDLYSIEQNGKKIVAMVEVHKGIAKNEDPGNCGVALIYDGTVLDGWSLPPVEWSK